MDTSATSLDLPTTLALIENVDMVQLMLDSELAGGPLLAYTRIQKFIAKVSMFFFGIHQTLLRWFAFFSSFFLMNFSLQAEEGQTRVNTFSTIHKGLNFLFEDIPENLPVPNISTDVRDWNKLHDYYECFFAFAKYKLYDHGVVVHCASANVSRMVFNWAHTYDFYVAEDWFGMTDLDLQSSVVQSGMVCNSISYSDFDLLFISLISILIELNLIFSDLEI